MKKGRQTACQPLQEMDPELTLTRLEAGVFLIDHIDATLAADNAAVSVTGLERLQ